MEKTQRNKLLDKIMGIEFIQLAKFWNYEGDNKLMYIGPCIIVIVEE